MNLHLKNKIVGAFNSDFGANYGFGIDDYYKIKNLWLSGYINKLIFRDYVKSVEFDYSLIQRSIPLGKAFPRILTGLEIYTKSLIKTTFYDQKLFDFFASKKIPNIKNGFFFSVTPYPKCVKKAKELGYTVILASLYHPKWGQDFIFDEYRKYKITPNPVFQERIFKRSLDSIGYADFLFVPSEIHKKTFIDNGFDEKRIIIIPLGTNIPSTKKKKNEKLSKIKFLFVANATLLKGLQYLISAWKNLQLKDAELTICGSILPEIEDLILNDVKNCQTINYVGFINNLKPYYENSSVFILPSPIDGMPRVVLDAMSYGLPIIATQIAAPCVKNNHDGIIIKPQDVESIENAILYLYENKKEIIRMGKNAEKTIELFTWENHSKKVAESFEHIAAINL